MKLMMKVVKADNTSARGSRKVLPVNLTPLQGFEFNPYGEIGKNVKMEITATYDRATGTVKLNIPSNVPQDKVNAPEGATHFKYALAAAEIDFDQSTSRVLSANSDQIVWGPQTEAGLSLSVGLNPNSTLPVFIGLSLEFSQTVNGTFYPLKNSASNGCSIILVSIA